jgi:hypothetical protein
MKTNEALRGHTPITETMDEFLRQVSRLRINAGHSGSAYLQDLIAVFGGAPDHLLRALMAELKRQGRDFRPSVDELQMMARKITRRRDPIALSPNEPIPLGPDNLPLITEPMCRLLQSLLRPKWKTHPDYRRLNRNDEIDDYLKDVPRAIFRLPDFAVDVIRDEMLADEDRTYRPAPKELWRMGKAIITTQAELRDRIGMYCDPYAEPGKRKKPKRRRVILDD